MCKNIYKQERQVQREILTMFRTGFVTKDRCYVKWVFMPNVITLVFRRTATYERKNIFQGIFYFFVRCKFCQSLRKNEIFDKIFGLNIFKWAGHFQAIQTSTPLRRPPHRPSPYPYPYPLTSPLRSDTFGQLQPSKPQNRSLTTFSK